MLTKEEFKNLITSIKEKLDDTTQALVSEELLNVLTNYNLAVDEIESKAQSVADLTKDNEELLKVNGKLFQKIGFEKVETETEEPKSEDEEIKLEEIINEKGEMI
ncbi:MAG: hypothetical protein SPJ07_01815 [Bacilli bacterium]|jgi:hypothetical protein|nr:hypothetical protein [Bacilli bacterium]